MRVSAITSSAEASYTGSIGKCNNIPAVLASEALPPAPVFASAANRSGMICCALNRSHRYMAAEKAVYSAWPER